MNRPLLTAAALMLAGGVLWFGFGALDGGLDSGVPAPIAEGDASGEGGAELAGEGSGALAVDLPLEPHILTGTCLDPQGAVVREAVVSLHARELPFGLPVDGRLSHFDLGQLFRCPTRDSWRGRGGADTAGRVGVGGLPPHEALTLVGIDVPPSRVLLASQSQYAAGTHDVGSVVFVPAVDLVLRPESPLGTMVSAFARRSVSNRGSPLHWYAPPFDPKSGSRIKAPPGPVLVWVHRRGVRHDLHAVLVSSDQASHTLPVIDSNTRISLRVRDGAGNPVTGAQAVVWSGPKADPATAPASIVLGRTLADGQVVLDDIVPGHVQDVHVGAKGFVRHTVPVGRVLRAGEQLHFDVVLEPGADLSGVVVGPADVPVPGARVQLGARPALTDGEGRFRFEDVPQGPTTLRAQAPGYMPTPRPGRSIIVRPETSATVHRIQLQPGAAIRGRVYRPDGSPAPHARVHPHAPGPDVDPWEESAADVRSDSEGSFSLGGLAPGRAWTLTAVLDDLVSVPLEPFVPHVDQEMAALRLDLQPAGVIAGRVLDSDGEPVEAQSVQLLPYRRYQQVGADGSFHFSGLAPGAYVVLLEKRRELIDAFDDALDDGGKTRHEVTIEVGTHVTDLVLRAPARAVLEGLLVDKDGNPVPGARVEIHDKERAWMHANPGGMFLVGDHGGTVTTDGAGRFRLAGLWGGELDYVITVDGVVAGEKFRVPTPGLRIVKPEPRGRKLTVRFQTPEGGVPPRGSFAWRLLTRDDEAWNGFEEEARGRSAALIGGEADIVVPTRGDHLQIDAPVWRTLDGQLAPWRASERYRVLLSGDTVTIELQTGGTLEGRVLDAAYQVVPHATVELAYENEWDEYGEIRREARVTQRRGEPDAFAWPSTPDLTVRADASGAFRFVGLRPERCYLRAVGIPGKRSGALVEAVPGDPDVEVRMAASVSIRGRVLDMRGRPVAGIKVGTQPYAWRGSVQTDANGAFELTGFEVGSTHTVHVHVDEGRALPYLPLKDEGVPAGGPPLTLRLERGVFIEGVVVDQAGASVLEGLIQAQRVGEPLGEDPPTVGISREGNHFQLGPLPPGEYELMIGSGWHQDVGVFRTAPLRVTAPARDLRFEVQRCWELRGRVEGGQGYRWHVYWCPLEPIELPGDDKTLMMDTPGHRRRTTLSSDGTFEFPKVREAQGDLYVFGPGDEYALLRDVTSDSGVLEIQLDQGFPIGGRVEGAGAGRDLRLRQRGIARTFKTGKGGTFLVRGLPPGIWTLEEYDPYAGFGVGSGRTPLPPIQVEAGNREVVYGAK